jgi:hypothetical protein
VLSHKLHGTRNKGLTHREVRSIVKTLVEWGAMEQQAEVRELLGLMECPDFSPTEWSVPPLKRLVAASSRQSLHLRNIQIPFVEYEVPLQGSGATHLFVPEKGENLGCSQLPHQDWGEAMDVSRFFGREKEVVELEQWIVEDHCRLVILLSSGGFGKTALSVKLTQQVAG